MAKKELYRYIMANDAGKPAQSIATTLEALGEALVETLDDEPCLIKYNGQNRRKIRITIKVETV